ncbi:MAG: hypothetical protein JXR15_13110 [Shimia sp.]|uniref:hypothetical protein n=1 Tax=Shimia sp. TaxID=1954381 RepID=UPI003B8AB73E
MPLDTILDGRPDPIRAALRAALIAKAEHLVGRPLRQSELKMLEKVMQDIDLK